MRGAACAAGYSVTLAHSRPPPFGGVSGRFFRRAPTQASCRCLCCSYRSGAARRSQGPGRNWRSVARIFLFRRFRAGPLVAHLHHRHLRARSLPTTCGARDQSDPLRCHLRSIGLLAGRAPQGIDWNWQAKRRSSENRLRRSAYAGAKASSSCATRLASPFRSGACLSGWVSAIVSASNSDVRSLKSAPTVSASPLTESPLASNLS